MLGSQTTEVISSSTTNSLKEMYMNWVHARLIRCVVLIEEEYWILSAVQTTSFKIILILNNDHTSESLFTSSYFCPLRSSASLQRNKRKARKWQATSVYTSILHIYEYLRCIKCNWMDIVYRYIQNHINVCTVHYNGDNIYSRIITVWKSNIFGPC